MQETGSIALGGVGLALLAYGLVSTFGTGPELGERTINQVHNWGQICQSGIERRAQPQQVPSISLPQIDTCRMFFGIYGERGQDYCDMHGHRFNRGAQNLLGTIGTVTDALNAPTRALEQARIEQSVADAPDRCACAANLVLEEERLSFALYAGSARLITPPSISNLQSELRIALSSPRCDFGE